ncbi:unnamed protein product [Amoebophrya sp. A120]|nr:unnamed protein product [Amoebophrya sp. A120]|eukprot:GSA120T00016925001.1
MPRQQSQNSKGSPSPVLFVVPPLLIPVPRFGTMRGLLAAACGSFFLAGLPACRGLQLKSVHQHSGGPRARSGSSSRQPRSPTGAAAHNASISSPDILFGTNTEQQAKALVIGENHFMALSGPLRSMLRNLAERKQIELFEETSEDVDSELEDPHLYFLAHVSNLVARLNQAEVPDADGIGFVLRCFKRDSTTFVSLSVEEKRQLVKVAGDAIMGEAMQQQSHVLDGIFPSGSRDQEILEEASALTKALKLMLFPDARSDSELFDVRDDIPVLSLRPAGRERWTPFDAVEFDIYQLSRGKRTRRELEEAKAGMYVPTYAVEHYLAHDVSEGFLFREHFLRGADFSSIGPTNAHIQQIEKVMPRRVDLLRCGLEAIQAWLAQKVNETYLQGAWKLPSIFPEGSNMTEEERAQMELLRASLSPDAAPSLLIKQRRACLAQATSTSLLIELRNLVWIQRVFQKWTKRSHEGHVDEEGGGAGATTAATTPSAQLLPKVFVMGNDHVPHFVMRLKQVAGEGLQIETARLFRQKRREPARIATSSSGAEGASMEDPYSHSSVHTEFREKYEEEKRSLRSRPAMQLELDSLLTKVTDAHREITRTCAERPPSLSYINYASTPTTPLHARTEGDMPQVLRERDEQEERDTAVAGILQWEIDFPESRLETDIDGFLSVLRFLAVATKTTNTQASKGHGKGSGQETASPRRRSTSARAARRRRGSPSAAQYRRPTRSREDHGIRFPLDEDNVNVNDDQAAEAAPVLPPEQLQVAQRGTLQVPGEDDDEEQHPRLPHFFG